MLRRTAGAVGRVLISAGVLLLLFIAYQLWGTNVSESHAQSALGKEYQQLKAHESDTLGTPGTTTSTVANQGDALGIITIPKIHLQKYLVQGTDESDLQKGPGHYVDTPMPGQPGNVAIAGHRTTYGAPFYNLDQLRPGDRIEIQMASGTFWYSVTGSEVVDPSDVAVVAPTRDNRLTLTTCNPRYSASTRLVVSAALVGPPEKPASTTPTTRPSPAARAPRPENLTTGAKGAVPHTIGWGILAAAVWLATWLASRRFGWRPYLVGAPVFLVPLFFFYENIARILPASV